MARLTIGVSNNDLGVHINVIQPLGDGGAAIIYSGQAPKGDSFGQFDTVECCGCLQGQVCHICDPIAPTIIYQIANAEGIPYWEDVPKEEYDEYECSDRKRIINVIKEKS